MAKNRIEVCFETPEQLRSEFQKNVVNGGMFIPTERPFEVRQAVGVDIELGYAPGELLRLAAEIVHILPPEMAVSGATPGIAVQFEASAEMLRQEFEPLLGHEVVQVSPDVDDDDSEGRRGAKRRAVRVPIRVMPALSPPFETSSRDLSATGILLSIRQVALPLGEIVRICLWHPSGEPSVEIDGKVVREVKNKRGRIAAVAVAFDKNQSAAPEAKEVIGALSQASHQSQLGGISGSIADLGMANLLQMFGASAPRGTVVFNRDGEQGFVAFAEGSLLTAELGPLRDSEAMMALLDWGDGRFDFQATVEEELLASTQRRPLAGALLEAVCAIDERDQAAEQTMNDGDGAADWAERTFVMESEELEPRGLEFRPDMVFDFDPDAHSLAVSDRGKVEEAVLDLAKAGLPLQKLVEIIPEDESAIQAALEGLVESGVLRPR